MVKSRKLKIIHLRDSSFVGGPEKLILGQVEELRGKGFDFVLTSFEKRPRNNELLREAQRRGINVFALRGGASGISLLIDYIRTREIDLISCHDYKSNLYGIIASKICGIPAVSIFHGRTSHSFIMKLYEKVDDRILSFFDSVVCVSRFSSKVVRERVRGIRNVRVVYNAIKIDECIAKRKKTNIREELGLPKDFGLIVQVGRVSPEKDQFLFVKSAIEIISMLPRHAFLVVGDGPELANLKELVRSKNCSSRVLFLGHRSDAISIIDQANLLVLTSKTEGMPITILEAFAVRTPVLSTPVGGIPEIVLNGETGHLCSSRDPVIFGKKILDVLNCPNNSRIVETAFHFARKKLSFSAQCEKLAKIYAEVIAEATLENATKKK